MLTHTCDQNKCILIANVSLLKYVFQKQCSSPLTDALDSTLPPPHAERLVLSFTSTRPALRKIVQLIVGQFRRIRESFIRTMRKVFHEKYRHHQNVRCYKMIDVEEGSFQKQSSQSIIFDLSTDSRRSVDALAAHDSILVYICS